MQLRALDRGSEPLYYTVVLCTHAYINTCQLRTKEYTHKYLCTYSMYMCTCTHTQRHLHHVSLTLCLQTFLCTIARHFNLRVCMHTHTHIDIRTQKRRALRNLFMKVAHAGVDFNGGLGLSLACPVSDACVSSSWGVGSRAKIVMLTIHPAAAAPTPEKNAG